MQVKKLNPDVINTLNKKKLVNIKMSESEFQSVRVKAHRYTGGNLSAWVRYAAIHLVPKETDLVEVEEIDEQ